MMKKLTLLGLAVVALAALAVPAIAGATTLKEETAPGVFTPVKEGEPITLTQDEEFPVITESSTLGTIECEHIMVSGILKKNTGGEVFGEGTGGEASPCFVNGTPGATVTSVTGNIKSSGSSMTGTASFKFVIKIPNLGTCTFTSEGEAEGQFTTGTDTIEFPEATPAALEGSPAFCGAGELYGGLTVETEDGTPVYLFE
jgi:hypothetical protein